MGQNPENEAFLVGEIVYLRKTNIQLDVIEGEWHSWFNDKEITKYLIHGVFPMSREQEAEFVKDQLNDSRSLLLSIVSKESNEHIGIISLKSIDLINRNAEIVIIMGFQKVIGAALEAMALMTEHAFERLNLIKLYAGQHEGLWKWVNSLELIGYRIEGYRRHGGVRNGEMYDIVLTGITAENYFNIKKERGKLLTDNLYKQRRKENLFPNVREFFNNL